MHHLLRTIPLALSGKILGLWTAISLYGVWRIAFKSDRQVPDIEELNNFSVQNISLKAEDGTTVSAWWIPQNENEKVVILLNGRGLNRSMSIPKARIYLEKGYSVLLPDLRGTGRSGGKMMSLGWREKWDMMACYKFVKKAGYHRIIAHGYSLGAATILYTLQKVKDYKAIVLESCYLNNKELANNLMDYVGLPHRANILLSAFLRQVFGFKLSELQPEKYVQLCQVPTLFMAGDAELLVKKADTESLFAACTAPFKKLHWFRGARHESFVHTRNEEYTQVLNSFLDKVISF